MNWFTITVLVLLAVYVLTETVTVEGFVGLRSDVAEEEYGWTRDLRYKAVNVDVQGLGVGTDFCRAVMRNNDDSTLRISCALGGRDGMNTMEYNTPTVGEGFRMNRDEYWKMRPREGRNRANYCRIVKDITGEWYASCVVPGFAGEERDTDPGPNIADLLEAYEGIMVWWRWLDDQTNYAGDLTYTPVGRAEFPEILNATVSRGLELNRWPIAAQEAGLPKPPALDYLRLGDFGDARSLRAIATWVWWDNHEDSTILELSDRESGDRIVLGLYGGGKTLVSMDSALNVVETATYYFEIWEGRQRIFRLNAPMSAGRIGAWQHVAITTVGTEDWQTTWQFWIDGVMVVESAGRMSPAMEMTENYIGRKLRGCLRDFRMYSTPFGPRIATAIEWSQPTLHPRP
jgi:hypothetical protein